MKLQLVDKLRIIELYREGFYFTQLAKMYKVSYSTISVLVRQYREHGIESFKPKLKNTRYPPDFKFQIVQRILNGESKSSVAVELAVNVGMIFFWVKKYQELGYNGLITKQGRPRKMKPENKTTSQITTSLDEKEKRIKELEEKNAQLEMENELLKKLRALVQQRTQQHKKKK